MKATVDADVCIGCGLCAAICSEVSEMVTVAAVPTEVESACKEAEEQCPVTAITIEEYSDKG